ncbi:GNAT family N-acetyltransferase [Kribbella yunnanensis]|uniref:GNAT family N-acetyltransferase n=1 Tax=Kribbella yunnanensis TaxID=190194 RepID=A0ABN2I010_9ACTN
MTTTWASGKDGSHRATNVLSMIRLVVRPYENPDAQRLVQALYAEQLDTYGFADPPESEVASDYVVPFGMLLVAYTSAGKPVGCGGYRTYDAATQTAEIRKMYVDPSARGQRLGYQILSKLEHEAAARGATQMVLETGALNIAAIGLYTSSGYEAIPSYVEGRRETNRAFAKTLAADQGC